MTSSHTTSSDDIPPEPLAADAPHINIDRAAKPISGMESEEVERLIDETAGPIIASTRVEGTPVYRPNGDKIGTIRHVMIDKRSGQTSFVVMNFGGFLGMGEDAYPLRWQDLTYNKRLDGYEVHLTDSQFQEIQGGPDSRYHEYSNLFPPVRAPVGVVG